MGLFRRKSKESDELPEGVTRAPDGGVFIPTEMAGDLAENYPHVQLLTQPDQP